MRLRPVTDAGSGDGASPQLVDDVLRHPRLGGQRTAGEQHRGGSVPVCVHEAPALPEDDLAAPAHQTRAVQQQTDAGSAAGDAGVAGYGGPFSGQGAGQQEQVGGVVRRSVGGEPNLRAGHVYAVHDQRGQPLLAGACLQPLGQGQACRCR